jgi:HAD superfamily hydrolase (TIGR01450 family)
VDDHDVVLLDLDGVVYVGPHAVEGAAAALGDVRAHGAQIAFVTNNAARTPEQVAAHLRELGVDASARDVVTSAPAAARMLADDLDDGDRVLVVGAEGLREAVRAVGLTPVDAVADGVRAVVQGFSPQTSWAMLDEACVAVRSGLRWVATNLDSTLPTPRGPAPGNGALVEVVARTTGVRPEVAGKPARTLLDAAVERTHAQRALFVGDRLDTDMAAARAADMAGLHVLTGVSAVVDLLSAPPDQRPTFLAGGLGGLLERHVAPLRSGPGANGTAWFCADGTGARARWTESEGLALDVPSGAAGAPPREAVSLDVVRVACAAVWGASAEGGGVDLAQARTVLAHWTAPFGWDR